MTRSPLTESTTASLDVDWWEYRTPDGARITRAQCAILLLLDEAQRGGHEQPTARELACTLGYAGPGTIWWHVRRLEAAGWLTHRAGSARTLRVTAAGRRALEAVAEAVAREVGVRAAAHRDAS